MLKINLTKKQVIGNAFVLAVSGAAIFYAPGAAKVAANLVTEWAIDYQQLQRIQPILDGIERAKNTPIEKLPLPKSMVFDYIG